MNTTAASQLLTSRLHVYPFDDCMVTAEYSQGDPPHPWPYEMLQLLMATEGLQLRSS